jgi:signal transduction histidine kinase
VPAALRCSLEITGDAKGLPPHVGEELYLIMGEAVRNAVRHAGATELSLAVTVTETQVSAAVRDDGRGFDPARAPGGGLLGMGERAQLLCGSLEVTGGPGRGTIVTVRVPLPGGGR